MNKVLSILKNPFVMVAVTVLAVEYIDSRSGSVRSFVSGLPLIGDKVVGAPKA